MKNKIINQYKNNKKDYKILFFVETAIIASTITYINVI